MINSLVVILFIIILLLVLTVVEQADTIKRLFLHNIDLINDINKRVKLPALSAKDIENINSLLNELNFGIGFLELSGHLKSDKIKIELLKRTLNHYIVKSPLKDVSEEQRYVLLEDSMLEILHELTGKDDWDLDNEEDIFEATNAALRIITTVKRAAKLDKKERSK